MLVFTLRATYMLVTVDGRGCAWDPSYRMQCEPETLFLRMPGWHLSYSIADTVALLHAYSYIDLSEAIKGTARRTWGGWVTTPLRRRPKMQAGGAVEENRVATSVAIAQGRCSGRAPRLNFFL